MFEIETSHANRLIYLRMSGAFTVEGARECAAAKERAVQALGPPYSHSTLLDVRDFRIQPQDIFAVFTGFVANTKHKSRKIAVVGGEGSARMQFRRVVERDRLRDDMRFFTEVSDAREWLEESQSTHNHELTSDARPTLPRA